MVLRKHGPSMVKESIGGYGIGNPSKKYAREGYCINDVQINRLTMSSVPKNLTTTRPTKRNIVHVTLRSSGKHKVIYLAFEVTLY